MGRSTDELVVELDVAREAGLSWCVNGPVLTEPRTEALLEPQRHQRPEAEQPDPEVGTGVHQLIEEGSLVFGRDPQLIAELPRVAEPADTSGDHADVHRPEVHEPERGRQEISVSDLLQHVARTRSGQRQTHQAQTEHT